MYKVPLIKNEIATKVRKIKHQMGKILNGEREPIHDQRETKTAKENSHVFFKL